MAARWGWCLMHWEEVQARVRPWLWEDESHWTRGGWRLCTKTDTRIPPAGSASPLSRQELPSGLGSPELQVGRFVQEDPGAPREEKKDSRKNFLIESGLSPEGCVQGLVYRDQSFSNTSSAAGALSLQRK